LGNGDIKGSSTLFNRHLYKPRTDTAATSRDLLTELRFETHQLTQDTLYAAADSLCHSAEFYRQKTLSLEEANSKLEQQQQAAEKRAEKTADHEELTNLGHEYRSLRADPVRSSRCHIYLDGSKEGSTDGRRTSVLRE
jgi:hypothetical protein